jgi:hypothetical protein
LRKKCVSLLTKTFLVTKKYSWQQKKETEILCLRTKESSTCELLESNKSLFQPLQYKQKKKKSVTVAGYLLSQVVYQCQTNLQEGTKKKTESVRCLNESFIFVFCDVKKNNSWEGTKDLEQTK